MNVLGIIGGGNMGQALLKGLLTSGRPPASILVSEPNPEMQQRIQKIAPVKIFSDTKSLIEAAEGVILAIKPQAIDTALRDLAPPTSLKWLLSICAGIPIATLQPYFPKAIIARAMPNTPFMIGQGVTGLFGKAHLPASLASWMEQLFSQNGLAFWVETESLLDAVTAIFGSGPGYFFYCFQAFIEAAETLGLDPALARRGVLETALGAAALALKTPDTLLQLQDQVTSKGGTTEAGIAALKAGNVYDCLKEAVRQAHQRATLLSRPGA